VAVSEHRSASRSTRTYFMLNVDDMGRAVQFYRAVVGPVVRFESEQISELKLGPATVALHAGGGQPRASGLVVEVPDVDQACRVVAQMGGTVDHGPYDHPDGTRFADVRDTEGNGFTLCTGGPS
jgi:predicted enzyme related to lactoylglutathione lyase